MSDLIIINPATKHDEERLDEILLLFTHNKEKADEEYPVAQFTIPVETKTIKKIISGRLEFLFLYFGINADIS